jgi:hydrogenase/urease accessory protein HupE
MIARPRSELHEPSRIKARATRTKGLRGFGLALLVLAGVAMMPTLAAAHLLPAQNATLHVVGDKVYAVVSVPLSALVGVDDDGDQLLSGAELLRHQQDISSQFLSRFGLSAGGERGRVLSTWALSPQTGGGAFVPTPYVVVLQVIQFSRPVGELVLHTDLFGTGAGEAQLSLRATRDDVQGPAIELAILDRLSTTHAFFRGAWTTFAQFVQVGVEHILTGGDHLLFLLTILIASAGWRYWLGVVTSFTLAHSITLSLSVFGIVHAPAKLVEPAIAASIVLMAMHNLLRPGAPGRWRIALVFACGLLHGLGFASALGQLGIDRVHRIATLAGFNVGVELGQLLFLTAVLGLMALARRLTGGAGVTLWPRLASATAALLGGVLLLQRIT